MIVKIIAQSPATNTTTNVLRVSDRVWTRNPVRKGIVTSITIGGRPCKAVNMASIELVKSPVDVTLTDGNVFCLNNSDSTIYTISPRDYELIQPRLTKVIPGPRG